VEGRDSATFLTKAQDLARDRAFVIGNIDAVVVAEARRSRRTPGRSRAHRGSSGSTWTR
jgi:2C-methyl-D-erythritol 2,4-cyclodiphosphate synthase